MPFLLHVRSDLAWPGLVLWPAHPRPCSTHVKVAIQFGEFVKLLGLITVPTVAATATRSSLVGNGWFALVRRRVLCPTENTNKKYEWTAGAATAHDAGLLNTGVAPLPKGAIWQRTGNGTGATEAPTAACRGSRSFKLPRKKPCVSVEMSDRFHRVLCMCAHPLPALERGREAEAWARGCVGG